MSTRANIPLIKGLPRIGYFLVSRSTCRSSVVMFPSLSQKAAVVRFGPTIMIPSISACPPIVVIFFGISQCPFPVKFYITVCL